jgi:hypothetical protein
MNTRQHPRTMQQAFGPYTSHDLQPMRQRETSSKEIAWYIVALVFVLLFINVVAR